MTVLDSFSEPIIDRKIDGKCWMIRTTVEAYLEMVSLDDNPFQRNLLSVKNYSKLIEDILNDTTFPPISVVSSERNLNLTATKNISGKFHIIDGLQRTNCLKYCVDQLKRGSVTGRFYTSYDDFKDKLITLEVWEHLEFKNILYKMLVLNTGQKKMDYGHQLDILNDTFFEQLASDGIRVIKRTEQQTQGYDRSKEFLLSDVTEGLVSYINQYPMSGKKGAAEFLFERFNVSLDASQEEDSLNIISDPTTYRFIVWTLTDFASALDNCYGERNPLRNYNVFLIGFCASLGKANTKSPENLSNKIGILMSKLNSDDDPLDLAVFESYLNKFTSGIGEKRRRYVYEAMRHFFTSPEGVDTIEWDSTYESFFQ